MPTEKRASRIYITCLREADEAEQVRKAVTKQQCSRTWTGVRLATSSRLLIERKILASRWAWTVLIGMIGPRDHHFRNACMRFVLYLPGGFLTCVIYMIQARLSNGKFIFHISFLGTTDATGSVRHIVDAVEDVPLASI